MNTKTAIGICLGILVCGVVTAVVWLLSPPTFLYARVEVIALPGDGRVEKEVEVRDEGELRQLVSFFPGAGGWKLNPLGAASYQTEVEVRLTTDTGETVVIGTDYELWRCGGKGDWPVEPGFEQWLRGLLARK